MATATVKYNFKTALGPGGSDAQDIVRYYGTVSFSAATDTYATGGLLALAGFAVIAFGPYSDRSPLEAYVASQAASGLTYLYNNSTKKLQIFAGGGSGTTGLTEVTNGTALNATTPQIFTDVVAFKFTFFKGTF